MLPATLWLTTASIAMALVAIGTVVNVSANTPVLGVSVCFCVAVRALKNAVVTRVGVAGRTYSIGVAMIGWKPGVIEDCTEPSGGCMTGCAGGGESCGNVGRAVGGVVDRLMTAITIGRQRGVVIVHVAFCTIEIDVRAGQGK